MQKEHTIKRKVVKLNDINPFHYIMSCQAFKYVSFKPDRYTILLALALSPWFISCGGKQRPASSIAASPAENIATEGDASGNTNNAEASGSNVTSAANTPSSLAGTTPPPPSFSTTSTAVAGTTSTTVVQQNKTRFAEVKPILQQRCTLCHGPGKMQPTSDWLDYATSKSRVDNGEFLNRIWTLKDDPVKGMPMGNATQMTDKERSLIKKWIEDGGLE